jgi:hypothetical protein
LQKPQALEQLHKALARAKIEDTINSPILRELERDAGTETVLSILFIELRKANDLINVDKRLKLTDEQCSEVVILLLEEFPTETLEDFALAFRKGITGAYDEKLLRVDVQVVFKWVRSWLDEKAEYRETLHKQTKSEELKPLTEEEKANIDKIVQESWAGEVAKKQQKDEEEYNKFRADWLREKYKKNEKNTN